MTHVVVVGGGITGLACALELADAGARVTLLEASDRLGGNIRTSRFAGLDVDEAADAFLARVPEAVELCRRLGLESELVSPAIGSAYVWARGELRRLPTGGSCSACPRELLPVARSGILSLGGHGAGRGRAAAAPSGGARMTRSGRWCRAGSGARCSSDSSIPLIGGINAGDAESPERERRDTTDRQSSPGAPGRCCSACAPSARRTRRIRARPSSSRVRGGMGRLIDRLVDAWPRTRHRSRSRSTAPWTSVEVDSSGRHGARRAHRRRIDVESPPMARCWRVRPDAAASALAELVAVSRGHPPRRSTTPRSPSSRSPSTTRPSAATLDASGLLVPKPEQRTVTACSWASTSGATGESLVRPSSGPRPAAMATTTPSISTTTALVGAVLADLRRLMDVRADPTEVRVSRWPQSFPQYRPRPPRPGGRGRADARGRRSPASSSRERPIGASASPPASGKARPRHKPCSPDSTTGAARA